MYKCKCGREFEKSQSYVAHCGHCRIHLGREPSDRFGDGRSWAKGKTKYTDSRILSLSDKLKGREGGFKGQHHSEDCKHKLSNIARYNAQHHINGWKAGSNKIPNKYEEFTENFLISKGLKYNREVTISQSSLGNKNGSYYQLDFLIENAIDLEIDGSAHNDVHDSERDNYVSKMYQIYRIKHNDSIEQLETELNKFVNNMR